MKIFTQGDKATVRGRHCTVLTRASLYRYVVVFSNGRHGFPYAEDIKLVGDDVLMETNP